VEIAMKRVQSLVAAALCAVSATCGLSVLAASLKIELPAGRAALKLGGGAL
jgi:hypothetical protein